MNAPETSGAEPQSVLEQETARRAARLYNDAHPLAAAGQPRRIAVFRSRLVPWPARGAPGYVDPEWFQLKRGSTTERFEDLGLHFDPQCTTDPHPGQKIRKPARPKGVPLAYLEDTPSGPN